MSLVYGGAKSDDFQFVEGDEIYVPEGCYALWQPDLDGAGILLREQLGYSPPGGVSTDWLTASSAGTVSKVGTWEDASADAAGTADYYRLYASNGTTCHEQGTVTATGGGGDLTLNTITTSVGLVVTITGWTRTAPGA